MRAVLGLVVAGVVAAVGAVILGEYNLVGVNAVVGFPLYGLAVAEVATGVGRRLAIGFLGVLAALVGLGLTWALWISFNHFRRETPSPLSWAMAVSYTHLTLPTICSV